MLEKALAVAVTPMWLVSASGWALWAAAYRLMGL